MIEVGIAGGGVGLRLHHSLLAARTDCRVTRVRLPHVDPTSGRRPRPAPEGRWDLLVLATPPFAQLGQLEDAEHCAGRVLCEKPAGLGSGEIEELLARCPSLDRVVSVNYQLRFDPALDLLRSLLAEPWSRVTIVYESGARRGGDAPSWYTDPLLGGGVDYAILGHLIDLVHFLVGPIAADRRKPGGLDRATLTGSLAGGGLEIRVDAVAEHASFSIGVEGTGETAWLDMIDASVADRPVRHPLIDAGGRRALSSRATRPWRASQARLYDALLGGRGELPAGAASLNDAVEVHRVLESARS